MNIYVIQVMNGLGNGMIYFLVAVGFSIMFGIMHFMNVAHGSLYMLGAYVGYAVATATGSLWVAIVAAPLGLAILAWAGQAGLRRLQALTPVYQILATIGVAMIIGEIVIMVWGDVGKHLAAPQMLRGTLALGGFAYPRYRLFVIGFSALLALILWLLLERTNFGAILRAGTESPDMVSLLGIDIERVFAITLALGVGLAALAGVLAAPMRGLEPSMADDALATAFAVVVIGGMGSFGGALAAALLVGLVQSLMTLVWSAGADIAIFVAMSLVILTRPRGLFGGA
jgi:branched-chain amino acid transport system permease protein